MRFRMAVERKKANRHFFCKKMAKVAVRLRPYGLRRDKQGFTSLCRQAQLHSKGAAFSSLPRRNAMKPGHLHQIPEALLACPP